MVTIPLLLLLAFQSVSAYHFSLIAHWRGIQHFDVRGIEKDHLSFRPHEERLYDLLKSLLNEDLHEFFIDSFEIHAEDIGKPSAIMKAYLSSPLDEETVLQKITSEVSVLHMLKIDELPKRSVFIGDPIDGVNGCTNGGVILPNRTCACQPFTDGSTCQNVLCQNQGVDIYSTCVCPPGYTGRFCEPQACTPPSASGFTINQQEFILVVNTKNSMAYVLNTLLLQVGDVLDRINRTNPNLFSTYTAVIYIHNEDLAYSGAMTFFAPQGFLHYLTGIRIHPGFDRQPTFWALYTLTNQVVKSSNIFVFTDSLISYPEGNNYTLSAETNETMQIERNFAWRNKIMFFLSQPSYQALDTSDDGYDAFRRVAQSLHSDVVSYDEREISNVLPLLSEYVLHENIALRYSVPETTAQTISIPADSPDQNVTVLVTVDADGKLPDVKTGNGEVLTPTTQGKRVLVYHTTSAKTSSFVITGTTPWSFRAFVHSPSTAYISYSLDQLFDGADSICYAELLPIITGAQVGGDPSGLTLTWLDLQSGINISTPVASTTRSQKCNFQYSFGNVTNNCTPGPYAQKVTYKSANGQNEITRILPGLCMHIDNHERPEFVCRNNGTSNGYECECPEYFDGIHCEEIVCSNFGTVNPFPGNGQPYCFCKEGFEGEHCEILTCSQSSNDTFNVKERTLSLILQSSMSQGWISPQIQQGLEILLNQTSSGAYSQFLLTTFNSIKQGGVYNDQMKTAEYKTEYTFTHAVSQVAYTASNVADYASYNALYDAIKNAEHARSSFFFFIDSPFRATEDNQTDEVDIAKALIENQHQLTIIITPRFGMADLCMTDDDAFSSHYMTSVSGGTFLNLCNQHGSYENDPIIELFTGYGLVQNEFQIADQMTRETTAAKMLFQPAFDSTFYVVVNSDKTENFTLTYTFNDGTDESTPSSIISMPFLAIYELNVNLAGGDASYITVQGAEGTSDGYLFIKLMEKSEISAFLSYSPNPSVDNLYSSVILGSDFYPVVHFGDYNLTEGYQYSLIGVDDNGVSSYFGESSTRNESCSYEKVFTNTYACNLVNRADIMKVIVPTPDSREVTRSFRTFCYIPKGEICLHGGVFTDDGLCQCTARYSGEYCQNPRCVNGRLNHKYQCQCFTGYTGTFCEYEACAALNFWEFQETRGQNFKQIVFILNTNIDQLMVNQQMSALVKKVIMDMFFDMNDIRVYTLITFDEKDVNFVITTTENQEFQKAIQTATSTVNSKIGESTKALDAIQLAYMTNIEYPSIVYLFTGSDSAPPPAELPTLLKKRANTQVNIIYTPSNTNYPSYPGGPNGPALVSVARMSRGRILPVTQTKVAQLDEVLTYGASANQLVLDSGVEDCSVPTNFTFHLEAEVGFLSITVTGIDVSKDGYVVLISPLGIPFKAPPIFKDNMVVVFYYEGIQGTPGQWTLTVRTTTGSCYVQARVNSALTVIPAFTAWHHDDFDAKMVPFSEYTQKKETYVTFRVSNNSATLERFSVFQTDPMKPWADSKEKLDISLTLRDVSTCSFQWISAQFQLKSANNQKMVILGKDASGNDFERTFFFTVPDATDSASTCVNGQRNIFGECECDQDHFGDYCIDRICKNGGSTSFGGSCVCQNGYFGPFCEDYFKE